MAGDVTPIEIYCHFPALCEDKDLMYVFTPSRQHLGAATGTKQNIIMYMVKRHENFGPLYDECEEIAKKLIAWLFFLNKICWF